MLSHASRLLCSNRNGAQQAPQARGAWAHCGDHACCAMPIPAKLLLKLTSPHGQVKAYAAQVQEEGQPAGQESYEGAQVVGGRTLLLFERRETAQGRVLCWHCCVFPFSPALTYLASVNRLFWRRLCPCRRVAAVPAPPAAAAALACHPARLPGR